METPMQAPKSWFKGVATNLLSPHPWLFWLTVGAAILAKAMAQGLLEALAFLFGFYLLLLGSKVGLALLTGRSRDLLAGRSYRAVMRVLAGLLGVFALLLFREGLHRIRPGSEMNNIHKRPALDLPWS
jgi:threonine/homoserine/homoserine lactone efflux protein